jgi:hypothetical protein
MEFQYGMNWLSSSNKAVVSAKQKLESLGVLIQDKENNYTLSIPYLYHTDTGKDQDQDQVKGKDLDQETDQDQEKDKEYRKEMYEYMDYRFEQDKIKEEEFNKIFNEI